MRNTVFGIADELGQDGLILRHLPQMLAATPSPWKIVPRPGAHGEVLRGREDA